MSGLESPQPSSRKQEISPERASRQRQISYCLWVDTLMREAPHTNDGIQSLLWREVQHGKTVQIRVEGESFWNNPRREITVTYPTALIDDASNWRHYGYTETFSCGPEAVSPELTDKVTRPTDAEWLLELGYDLSALQKEIQGKPTPKEFVQVRTQRTIHKVLSDGTWRLQNPFLGLDEQAIRLKVAARLAESTYNAEKHRQLRTLLEAINPEEGTPIEG